MPLDPTQQAQLDALIDAEVDRAMGPYRDFGLSDATLGEMERNLRFALRHHPTARALLRVLVDDPQMATSETRSSEELRAILAKKEGA